MTGSTAAMGSVLGEALFGQIDPLQPDRHFLYSRDSVVGQNQHAFAGELINHRQHPEPPLINQNEQRQNPSTIFHSRACPQNHADRAYLNLFAARFFGYESISTCLSYDILLQLIYSAFSDRISISDSKSMPVVIIRHLLFNKDR